MITGISVSSFLFSFAPVLKWNQWNIDVYVRLLRLQPIRKTDFILDLSPVLVSS